MKSLTDVCQRYNDKTLTANHKAFDSKSNKLIYASCFYAVVVEMAVYTGISKILAPRGA